MAPSERSIIHAVFHPDLAGMNIAEFRRIAKVIEQGSVQHYEKFDYDGPTFTIDARLASDFARLLDSQNNWVFQGKSSLRLLVIWVNEDGETTIEEQEHSLRLSSSEMAALRNRYLTERLSSDPEFFEGCAVPIKLITLD
jgi:hypothetical protein